MKLRYVALALALLLTLGMAPFALAEDVTLAGGELEVRANAVRTVAPDTAKLRVGVAAEDKTEQAAQAKANEVINRTIDALKGLGLEDKQIVTSGYNITRKYSYYTKLSNVEAYIARITLTVTVHDFDQINEVIDTAVAQGINDLGDIEFSYSDESGVYRQALKDAITAARSKAEDMAGAAGVTLEALLNLTETSGYNVAYYNMVTLDAAPAASAEADTGTQIMAGDIEISASVSMKYQIK